MSTPEPLASQGGNPVRQDFLPFSRPHFGDEEKREVLAVRENVAMADISTLGKFEIEGRDCIDFLNRVYVNDWDKLGIGRAR